jgi:hypothetical protein
MGLGSRSMMRQDAWLFAVAMVSAIIIAGMLAFMIVVS